MTRTLRVGLLAVVALALAACGGTSAVRVLTNAPADVAVDGQYLGAAPVTFPLPWRNGDNHINYAQRRVTVTAKGTKVYDQDISEDIAQKAARGDFQDGSQYGTGRTYTINVDVLGATKGP